MSIPVRYMMSIKNLDSDESFKISFCLSSLSGDCGTYWLSSFMIAGRYSRSTNSELKRLVSLAIKRAMCPRLENYENRKVIFSHKKDTRYGCARISELLRVKHISTPSAHSMVEFLYGVKSFSYGDDKDLLPIPYKYKIEEMLRGDAAITDLVIPRKGTRKKKK